MKLLRGERGPGASRSSGDSWLAGLWLYFTTAPARASTTPEPAAMSSK